MAPVALANPPNDCSQVISDCNIALNKADGVIKAKQDVIDRQNLYIVSLEGQVQNSRVDLQKAEEGRDAWYRRPEVDIPIGITIGIILAHYLVK